MSDYCCEQFEFYNDWIYTSYEIEVAISPDDEGNWNIEGLNTEYGDVFILIPEIKYCPFCGNELESE